MSAKRRRKPKPRPATPIRRQVYIAVNSERDFQDAKWGTVTQRPHEVGAWLTLMRGHLHQAELAWIGANHDVDAMNEIRKVIALGVACGEQHGILPR